MEILRNLLDRAIEVIEEAEVPATERTEVWQHKAENLLKDSYELFEQLDNTPSPFVPPFHCKMEQERKASTVKFSLPSEAQLEMCPNCKYVYNKESKPFVLHLTTGEYADGKLGEIFLKSDREGSFAKGMTDAFARSISFALQVGIPLEYLVSKFINARFEPMGITGRADIPFARSAIDLIFRWIGRRYLPSEKWESLGLLCEDEPLAVKEKKQIGQLSHLANRRNNERR